MVIKIKGSKFSLTRERDGAGESGPMLTAIDRDTGKKCGENGEIQVGKSVMCGSLFTRTFGNDWWLTTNIAEILERNEDDSVIKFKTENGSTYTVKGL